DRLQLDAGVLELVERRLQEPVRDLAVEPRRDDRDSAPLAVGFPLEQDDLVRDVQVAPGVLACGPQLRDRRVLGLLLGLLLRLRLRFGLVLGLCFRLWLLVRLLLRPLLDLVVARPALL